MTILLEILFFAFILGSDLISKELIAPFLKALPNGESYVVLDKIFSFTYVENRGASFGAFNGQQGMLIGITIIVMIALVGLLIWQKDMPTLPKYAILMIVGGGIGNLYDRIAFGFVRDFIQYDFLDTILETLFGTSFAIGNVADIYLCVGVLMVIVYIIFAFDEKDYSLKWRKKGQNE